MSTCWLPAEHLLFESLESEHQERLGSWLGSMR